MNLHISRRQLFRGAAPTVVAAAAGAAAPALLGQQPALAYTVPSRMTWWYAARFGLDITAKHHEGFAMWNSGVAGFTDVTGTTDYDGTWALQWTDRQLVRVG